MRNLEGDEGVAEEFCKLGRTPTPTLPLGTGGGGKGRVPQKTMAAANDDGRGQRFLQARKNPHPNPPPEYGERGKRAGSAKNYGRAHDDVAGRGRNRARVTDILPALAAAIVCTLLIAEAIFTAIHGRSNGDLMVSIIPILGGVFLSIPTGQAWWVVVQNLKKSLMTRN